MEESSPSATVDDYFGSYESLYQQKSMLEDTVRMVLQPPSVLIQSFEDHC